MADTAVSVFRPRPSGLGAVAERPGRIVFAVLVGLIAIIVEVARDGAAGALVALLIVGPVLAFLVWYGWSYRTRVRIELGPDEIAVTDVFGHRRGLRRDDIAEVTMARYMFGQVEGGWGYELLAVVLSRTGEPAVAFPVKPWPHEVLYKLWKGLGLPGSPEPAEPLHIRELNRRHPGLDLPMRYLHNAACQLLLVLGVFAYLALLVALFVVLFG